MMATPFVPVPVPMDGGGGGAGGSGRSSRRPPQRTQSMSSVSSSGSSRSHAISRTPPTTLTQSPVTRTRLAGELSSLEYSSGLHSPPNIAQSTSDPERPSTPTILGYEVMEERAKFTVSLWCSVVDPESLALYCMYLEYVYIICQSRQRKHTLHTQNLKVQCSQGPQ